MRRGEIKMFPKLIDILIRRSRLARLEFEIIPTKDKINLCQTE